MLVKNSVFPVPFESYLHPKRSGACKLQKFSYFRNPTWKTLRQNNKQQLELLPNNCFHNYCKISSIHGFSCMCDATTWQRYFWWFNIIAAEIVTLYFFSLNVLDMYSKSTITFYGSLQKPIDVTPFPSVTVCMLNRISKHKAETLAHKLLVNDTSMSTIELQQLFKLALWYYSPLATVENSQFEKLQNLLDAHNMNLESLLTALHRSCAEILVNCFWRDQRILCSKAFMQVPSMEGPCCQAQISEYGRDIGMEVYPEHATAFSKLGLRFVLSRNISDYGAFSLPSADYIVRAHNSKDTYSYFETEHLLMAGYHHLIGLELTSKDADEDLLNYSSQKRYCMKDADPSNLKWYTTTTYTRRKCKIDAWITLWYERCACVLPFFPRPNNERLCTLSVKDRTCFNDPIVQPVEPDSSEACLPSCEFISVSSNMKRVKIDYNHTFVVGTIKSLNDGDGLSVAVYFKGLTMMAKYMSIYKTSTSLLASMGGLIGLQLGISLISLYEIFFFVTLLPLTEWISKYYNNREKKSINNENIKAKIAIISK